MLGILVASIDLHTSLYIFAVRINDYADIRRNSASEETCHFRYLAPQICTQIVLGADRIS